MSNTRNIQDAALRTTKVLPAANATNVHDWIDLRGPSNAVLDRAEGVVELPATPDLVDVKTITLTIEDSALGTDADDAAIPQLATITDIGVATSAGGAGKTVRGIKFPSTTRRYVRLRNAVENGGGSNIAISTTFSVRF